MPPAPPGPIAIVSVNLAGVPGNGDSRDCGESCTNLSATGRFVAFTSEATDLVADDHNNRRDAFLRDMSAGVTVRVSVPHAGLGGEADDHSDNPSVSSDGRFVVFDSQAGNLVSGDSNGRRDVFLRDTRSGATVRVSQGLGAEADGASQRPCVSDDGRYVGFESFASNLVIGDTNGTVDVFVHDRETGTTERVSVHSSGAEANAGSGNCSMSGDGRIVAFESSATNLIDSDTNMISDIFVRDRDTNTTTRVSVDSSGNQATMGSVGSGSFTPSVSSDGRFVAFYSLANGLVATGAGGIYLHDRASGATIAVDVPNLADQGLLGDTANVAGQYPAISDDGRYVAFFSSADNLVRDDTNGAGDIFVHDRITGETARANLASDGAPMTAGGVSDWAGISGDGRYVNFFGTANPPPDIVPGDSNGFTDVFRAPNTLWKP